MNAIKNLHESANEALYILQAPYHNWTAIASQFSLEKGWDWWESPVAPFNVGNVSVGNPIDNTRIQFAEYPTLLDGIKGYCHCLLTTSFDDGKTLTYQHVLDAVRNGQPIEVVKALADSPYCNPPYHVEVLEALISKVTTEWEKRQTLDVLPESTTVAEERAETVEQENAENSDPFIMVTMQPPLNTLWGISVKAYGRGDFWTHLIVKNPHIDPRDLQEGQKVYY